ncbi:hypothetical protein [Luteimonas aquatica]|uniref:hypothetical protein n=1 Tax=Luteimonas aquatica TaxID=450364 RepID=UPI001F590A8C|nr:hypothetical protein [Luteimonas aquatica]
MPPLRLACLLLPPLAFACWSGPADAQIKRCTGPDGKSIFTDRNCGDVGATDALPRPATGSPQVGGKPYARGCSRNVRDLVYELTAAIDSRDTNRLAGLYSWSGMSNNGGYAVLSRLDAIANRPLIDISPVLPAPQLSVDAGGAVTLSGDVDASEYPGAQLRRAPVALRVDQGTGGGTQRTVFGLRKYMGCWWLTL